MGVRNPNYEWWAVSARKWAAKNVRINAAYDALAATYRRINADIKAGRL